MRLLKNVNKLPKKQIIYGLAIVLGICIIDGMIWKEHHQSQPVVSEVTLVRTTTVRLANAAQNTPIPARSGDATKASLPFRSVEKSSNAMLIWAVWSKPATPLWRLIPKILIKR